MAVERLRVCLVFCVVFARASHLAVCASLHSVAAVRPRTQILDPSDIVGVQPLNPTHYPDCPLQAMVGMAGQEEVVVQSDAVELLLRMGTSIVELIFVASALVVMVVAVMVLAVLELPEVTWSRQMGFWILAFVLASSALVVRVARVVVVESKLSRGMFCSVEF